jgi:hypothetical protein
MEMLIPFLVGAAVGVGLTLAVIFESCKVIKKEEWKEDELARDAMRSAMMKALAENANLRVALAAGEMTEEGKKVAAMTMAALDVVITTEKDEIAIWDIVSMNMRTTAAE